MSCNQSNFRGHRILLHECNIDNKSPIIEGVRINNSDLGKAYEDMYQNTIAKNMEDKTRMDHHHSIIIISNSGEENCPVYILLGLNLSHNQIIKIKAILL